VDFRNSVNTLHCDAVQAAVHERAPEPGSPSSSGPIDRAYAYSCKALPRAPIPSHAVAERCATGQRWWHAGVLPCPLDPSRETQGLQPTSRLLLYADDCYLHGRAEQLIAAFHILRDLGAALILHLQLHKCSSYGRGRAAVVRELGIGFTQDGFLACGTPLGPPAFVAPFVERQVDQVWALIDVLLALPLATEDKYLLLQSCLQPHMAHFLRNKDWELLHVPLGWLEAKLADATCCLMH
jgi:hypothetical protein